MLLPIKSAREFRKIVTYDFEWVPLEMRFRVGSTYDGEQLRTYYSIPDFVNGELTHRNRGKWFFAHAGGLADIQFLLNHLKSVGFRVSGTFSGSSLIIARISKGKNTWLFLDSYWLLRAKLRDIAKWIGEEKGGGGYEDDEEDFALSEIEFQEKQQRKREWYATVPLAQLTEYNQNDCIILHKAITQLEETLWELGGQLQVTLASCAMQLFRRAYLSQAVETNARINRLCRFAYIGSRVEVFRRDLTEGHYYDINSSFPYAMLEPAPGHYTHASRRIPNNPFFIAHCRINVPECYLPPLPLRDDKTGRIFFPTGQWKQWFTGIDLQFLEECGGQILDVETVLHFAPFNDLSAYANDLYNRRKNTSDKWEKIAFKLLLNSLYGKFAERSRKQQMHVNHPSPNRDNPDWSIRMPGVWLEAREAKVPHVHVPISAHITAIARRNLTNYLRNSISRGGKIYYSDTDGFATNVPHAVSPALGGLKLEQTISRGRYVAPKVYDQEGIDGETGKPIRKIKAKGFSRMNAERFMRLLEGNSISYERMRRVREGIRDGDMSPKEMTVEKRLRNEIPKRAPDGDDTRPWTVEEIAAMD